MTTPLNFDLTRQERSDITIGGKPYVLVELDGTQRDAYLNGLANRIKTTGTGKAATQSVKNFDGMQASLLTSTLFRIEGDTRVPVTVREVQQWPARVISDLFDAAKQLSSLDSEDEEDAEGND